MLVAAARIRLGLSIAFAPLTPQANPALGLWVSDRDTDVISVADCNGALCVTLVGIAEVPNADTPTPRECQKRIGSNLRWDAARTRYNGQISDPETNASYRGWLMLTGPDRLSLRAFEGRELFGETYRYRRFAGRVLPNCRIVTGTASALSDRTLNAHRHA